MTLSKQHSWLVIAALVVILIIVVLLLSGVFADGSAATYIRAKMPFVLNTS